MRMNSLLTPCKQGAVLTRYSNSFYITTCFLNTNKTNFSNVAERLTEGTIRFVLHTNLSVLHECNGCRGHCQHLCNSWWKKENTLSSIR